MLKKMYVYKYNMLPIKKIYFLYILCYVSNEKLCVLIFFLLKLEQQIQEKKMSRVYIAMMKCLPWGWVIYQFLLLNEHLDL